MEVDLAPQQAKGDQHRRHGDGERREELERQRGEEGDAQHGHGVAAIGLGHFRDNDDCAFRRAKNLQVGQSLHRIEQMPAKPRQRRPGLGVRPLRALTDQDQESHRQRQRAGEDRAGDPVERRDDDQDGEGQDGAGRERRKIAPPIGLDRGHRVGEDRHQFAGRGIDETRRAERADVIEQIAEEDFAHASRSDEAGAIGDPAEYGAQQR